MLSPLLSLFAVDFLATASPGPAFVVVTRIAACHGARAGLAAVLGVLSAAWLLSAAVLSGLTILFQAVPWLYLVLKIAGGIYLAYAGLMLLKGGRERSAADGAAAAELPPAHHFRKGLFVGLTNPKALVYFGSVFTLFLKPGSPFWLEAAAVGIVTFDCAVVYGLLGVLFSRPAVRRAYERLRFWVERAAGAVMTAFGLRLLLAND